MIRRAHPNDEAHAPMPPLESTTRLRLTLVGALFVLTGAVALVAEQVFEKLLSTVVGASTPAGAIVLAVYFAGLTAGGLLYGPVIARLRRPLRLYALLEGLVGLWALGLAVSFPWLQGAAGAVVCLAGDSRPALLLLRLLVACAWILPPTVAMGMTFPAMVGVLEQARVPGLHRRMARFYALNLLGAVLGAALAPYLLFPRVGLVGALLLAAGAEVGVVAAALALGRGWAGVGELAPERSIEPPPLLAFLAQPGPAALVAAAAGSGFLIFCLEVVWLHLVGAVIGTSVYAFANMLLAVLLGLLLGGLLSSLGRDRAEPLPLAVLPAVLLVAGWLLLLTGGLWDVVPAVFAIDGLVSSFGGGEALRLAACLVLVGLPATALGLVYPLLFRLPLYPEAQADRFAGLLAAANALGCIAGALVGGFVLLPGPGSEATLRAIIALVLALGLALALGLLVRLLRAHQPAPPLRRPLLATLVLLGGLGCVALVREAPWDRLALTSGTNVYFAPTHVGSETELLFWHEDSYGGFTTVVRNRTVEGHPWQVLLTNGKFQGNDVGERAAQVAFALVPVLHSEARDKALVIGLGTGQTAAVVAASGYRDVEIAEISPGIVAAARAWFPLVHRHVLERPTVSLHLEDGRNHLLRSPGGYDLVTIELNSVWFAGATSLYSREFYRLVRERLAPGGVLVQWIQLHHIAPEEVLSVMATLQAELPWVSLWQIGGQGLFLAAAEPLELQPEVLTLLGENPELVAAVHLVEARHGDLVQLLADTRVLSADELEQRSARAVAEGVPLTTDGNRWLEYHTPRHNLEPLDHRRLVLAALLADLPAEERAMRLARLLAE
jgi:spermidine synthase